MQRFETDTQHHLCAAQRDLFGGWELWRSWGANKSTLVNLIRDPAVDEAAARRTLEAVVATRLTLGYPLALDCGRWRAAR